MAMSHKADGEQAVVEADPPAPAEGTLAHQILYGSFGDVKLRAQEWAQLCSRDLGQALLVLLDLVLALSGLPGAVAPEDLEAEPALLVIRLPDWVRAQNLDPTIYPLLPSIRQARRSVANLEKFLSTGIGEQNGPALLDSQLVASLSRWLLVLPNAAVRSVRHVSTIAALAVAEALGHHFQALSRSHETLARQLQAASGTVTARQEAQLKRDVAASSSHAKEMNRSRNQLLETIVPLRSRDISEVIRVYTLSFVDKLMKTDPEMYLQNKWTARVFLMVHDPAVDVRLKALSVITQWYSPDKKRSAPVKEHLGQFAKSWLPHLVERVADVDPRVAAAALRCLRQRELAEKLQEDEFDTIVNLVIGSRDVPVREEAALFINQHVFQDPGICIKDKAKKRGDSNKEYGTPAAENVEDGRDGGGDALQELYNSEVAISMLIEYLGNYMGDKLRITERVVGAFWPRAPSLKHWSTMLNLCLVGEGAQRVGTEPISSKQRLALLYIIEAAVRRADDEVRTARPSEKEEAALRMNEACAHIIPELPRLMDLCRPEEQQFLLLSHICKMLVEYAVYSAQQQVLVNEKALCQALRKAIEDVSPMDTMKNCADSLLALARCFEGAKTAFLDISREVHRSCASILEDKQVRERLEELRPVTSRFLVLSNRGIDASFGSVGMLRRMLALLHERSAWMKERRKQLAEARDVKEEPMSPAPPTRGRDEAGGQRKRRRTQARPEAVADVRLALQLLEAAALSLMWHVRTTYWVQSQGSSEEARKAAENQVSEMLQGFSELPSLHAELPRIMAEVRGACMELIETDLSPYVQYHAFSAYMTLLQLSVGVSETLSLELVDGRPAPPTGWGATFEVKVPKGHMEVLYKYLNKLYVKVTDSEVEGVTFNGEGHRVQPSSIFPAPSQNTMTSVRHLALRTMEAPGNDPEVSNLIQPLEPADELLLAVLASRSILESELQDIYTGPLGLLLLTQCEKARPKALKEVAQNLLRRLREQSKSAEEFGEHFYAMQQEAIEGLFRCAGAEAALSLSLAFVKLWGIKPSPLLERPLYVVLREAILSCVTPDRSRLPLLEAYVPWIKSDFVRENRCHEIAEELRRQIASIGGDENMPHLERMFRRLQHTQP
ncbi:unnamed protein product [Effrenium voratum]|uniref:Uncharacterized protein n=1 Tax=Effrenium voratum TaxID=2562239 RepID=A0AA36J7V0_9DINO|nr:unnamed protein product [Effrenium voratum]CAJ1425768.1 unnamed protein product [Effrenium voratum]